jgi:hypothetical protein
MGIGTAVAGELPAWAEWAAPRGAQACQRGGHGGIELDARAMAGGADLGAPWPAVPELGRGGGRRWRRCGGAPRACTRSPHGVVVWVHGEEKVGRESEGVFSW